MATERKTPTFAEWCDAIEEILWNANYLPACSGMLDALWKKGASVERAAAAILRTESRPTALKSTDRK